MYAVREGLIDRREDNLVIEVPLPIEGKTIRRRRYLLTGCYIRKEEEDGEVDAGSKEADMDISRVGQIQPVQLNNLIGTQVALIRGHKGKIETSRVLDC